MDEATVLMSDQLAQMVLNPDDEFQPTGHWTRAALMRLKHLVTEETLTWRVIENEMKEHKWATSDGKVKTFAVSTLHLKCKEKGWKKNYAPHVVIAEAEESDVKTGEDINEVKEEDFAALNTKMRAELQATKKALAMMVAHVRKYQAKSTSLSDDDVLRMGSTQVGILSQGNCSCRAVNQMLN